MQGSRSSGFSMCNCKDLGLQAFRYAVAKITSVFELFDLGLWAFWYASIRSVFELFDVHCKPSCCILAINFLQRNLHNKNCKTKHWYAKKRVDGFTKNRKLTTLSMCVLSRNSLTGAFALSSWASLLWSSAFVVVNRQKSAASLLSAAIVAVNRKRNECCSGETVMSWEALGMKQ